jgi:phosphoglycolate phosphatase
VSIFVLWDIDGTLIRNGPRAGSLYLDSIEQISGTRPTERVGSPHGMTEGQLLAAILEVNGIDAAHLPEIFVRLDELSTQEFDAGMLREQAAGVAAAISAVADRGWTNALLTGNGPTRARLKVMAAGLDADAFDWEHSFFGHQSPDRHHLTALATAKLAGRDSVIIGDTPKDGEAADSAGIPFIAVATGAFTVDELRDTSALVVVEDLSIGLDTVLDAIASVPTLPGLSSTSAR